MSATGKTVLLVEDNEDNRIVYSTILRHFGYQVTEALNGEEGISKAKTEMPDLILMDISIPIIDGWEATQILKHDPAMIGMWLVAEVQRFLGRGSTNGAAPAGGASAAAPAGTPGDQA
jgi:CheY-like chemotaxis protein